MAGAPFGNKNAAKPRLWEAALKRALARAANSTINHGLDKVADKTVSAAIAGERWAIEEIGDRLDGKATQSIEHSGDITHRHAQDLTDGQLADIATGRSEGTPETSSGETNNPELH